MTMKTISSRDNPLYKELKHLAASSQARRKAGRTLLDGVHLCEAYLEKVGLPPLCVVGETALLNEEVTVIVQQCSDSHTQCIVMPDALFQALSQVEHGLSLIHI